MEDVMKEKIPVSVEKEKIALELTPQEIRMIVDGMIHSSYMRFRIWQVLKEKGINWVRDISNMANRIKSYEDACEFLGVEGKATDEPVRKLQRITKALNDCYWMDDESDFYIVVEINDSIEVLRDFRYIDGCENLRCVSYVELGLAYRYRDMAEYSAEQFKDLWKQVGDLRGRLWIGKDKHYSKELFYAGRDLDLLEEEDYMLISMFKYEELDKRLRERKEVK